MKTIINETQRGLLFKNGKFVKLLKAGKYRSSKFRTVEVLDIGLPITSENCKLETLLLNENFKRSTTVVEVPDMHFALHFKDGQFSSIMRRGKHAFFNDLNCHKFKLVDISSPEVSADIPEHYFSRIPITFYTKVEVAEGKKARLFVNQRFVRILDAGTYRFWKNGESIDVDFVDTRLTQMNIAGQEILTADKVSLRINFVLTYKITDYVKILTEIDNFSEQLHVAAQLSLREYIGRYKLDEILENKEGISKYVLEKLKEKGKNFFIEIFGAGVRDIILPGEIREIMNTVLIAEKKAQANVITRREEVASTRSLLNTARLMDENKTLYKLKELEFVERICENVGNININGNTDILSQLSGLLKSS